jgi:hypothetical protein
VQDLRESRCVRPVVEDRILRLQLPVEAQDVTQVIGAGLAEESHGRRVALRPQRMISGVSAMETGGHSLIIAVCGES